MLSNSKVLLASVCLVAVPLAVPLAIAADKSACMGCHADDEFAELSAGDISAAVRDAGIPPHKRFADISDADLTAIAAALAGS